MSIVGIVLMGRINRLQGAFWFLCLLMAPGTLHARQGAGSAVRFNGISSHGSVPGTSALNLSGQYTIEMFVKPFSTFDGSAAQYQGILDKGSFSLLLDKSDGKMKFVQNGGTDASFDTGFVLPGADHEVHAAAILNNTLIVGGAFTTMDGVIANHIARWNDTAWTVLDTVGLNGTVYALAVYNGELYAGGSFTSAGGVNASHIAKWDGTGWSAVSVQGMNNNVLALVVYNGELYAGGDFTSAGGSTANRIAKWDGSSWSPVHSAGMNNTVFSLVVHDSTLYAGGAFSMAGDSTAQHIAAWDGDVWSSVGGSGMNADVYALTVYQDELIAGGAFTTAGDSTVGKIARWDGTTWSNVGTSGLDHYVYALGVYGGDLYAGGAFAFADGQLTLHIARWNGSSWSSVGTGFVDQDVRVVTSYAGGLYVGGLFSKAGGEIAYRIAKWNGTAWSRVGNGVTDGAGMDYEVMCLTNYKGDLYAAGLFLHAGEQEATHVAKWNGSAWSPLPGGAGANCSSLKVYEGELYIGGAFSAAGGLLTNGIARWDGSQWHTVGTGLGDGSAVFCMTIYRGELYIGGLFTSAGGVTTSNIAKWNGSSWTIVGSPLGANGFVSALAVYHDELYVGGEFTTIGGISANRVAKWDGSSWAQVTSQGMDDRVFEFGVFNNELYAGGAFSTAGGVSANRIARWNGSAWSAVGAGVTSTAGYNAVYSLTSYEGKLYVGGSFTEIGGTPARNLATWNGTGWSAVTPRGANDIVYALTVSNGDLYMGGLFSEIGGVVSSHIAKWSHPDSRLVSSTQSTWDARQYHVALTNDGSNLRMYVNGTLQSTSPVGGTAFTSASPLLLGESYGAHEAGSSGEVFDGEIDELRIYNSALTEPEIRAKLNSRLGGTESGLIAYYRFDEGSDSSASDASGNGNTASLHGTSWITSTAPLGDTSVYTTSSANLELASNHGDKLGISNIAGSPSFVALMRNDATPNTTSVGAGLDAIMTEHYYEVWSAGGTTPAYDVTYHYPGNPSTFDEAKLKLGKRANAAGTTWDDAAAILNTNLNTLALGGESGTQYVLAENSQNPAPTTVSIVPDYKRVGDASFSMTIHGDNFISTSVVRVNGLDRSTTFDSISQVRATVAAGDLTNAGAVPVTVYNPSPGGGLSNAQTLVIDKALTAGLLTSSLNPSIYYETICFKDSIVTAPIPDGGAVQFLDNGSNLGLPVPLDSTGVARLYVASLSAGVHNIKAYYSGTANFDTSTSNIVVQVVATRIPTSVLLSSVNPSAYGQSVVFRDSVIGAVPDGGSVQFLRNGVNLGAPVSLDTNGVATLTFSGLPVGAHNITAFYGGSPNVDTSTSNTIVQSVTKRVPTVILSSSSNPSSYGDAVILKDSVVGIKPDGGSVQFRDNGGDLGAPVAFDSAGIASMTVSGLQVGTHVITAFFNGTSNFDTVTSNALMQIVVKKTPASFLTSSENPSAVGHTIIFRDSVGGSLPDGGLVQFRDDNADLGAPVLLDSTGVATLMITTLSEGTHYITAFYNGTANVDTGTSNIVVQVVNLENFPYDLHAGWNMISLAGRFGNPTVKLLFPTSTSKAFAYEGTYKPMDTLTNGTGYWMKFDSAQQVTIGGHPVAAETIEVKTNWNLIGSKSSPTPRTHILQIPSNIITSRYYGYNGGYSVKDTLMPAAAYWVKVSQPGVLILGDMFPPKHGLKGATSSTDGSSYNTLSIDGGEGRGAALYFGEGDAAATDLAEYEMPPLPPQGIFDARFASQRSLALISGSRKAEYIPILIQAPQGRTSFRWERRDDENLSYVLVHRRAGKVIRSQKLEGAGAVTLDVAEEDAFGLQAEVLPVAFKLYQNFPNPFNPGTTIAFDLPTQSSVTLTVYNILGQEVARLIDQQLLDRGNQSVTFDGSGFASGVYFYRLNADSFVELKKMILMK